LFVTIFLLLHNKSTQNTSEDGGSLHKTALMLSLPVISVISSVYLTH